MPSDITGTDILQDNSETGERSFRFMQGPIFANILLADEINRTPPKTQSALMQAMQEYQVTAGGNTYHLNSKDVTLKSTGRVQTIYYFSKDKRSTGCDLPSGKVVVENLPTPRSKNAQYPLRTDPPQMLPWR